MSNTEINKKLDRIDAIAYGFVNESGDGVTYDEYQYVAELISEVKELARRQDNLMNVEINNNELKTLLYELSTSDTSMFETGELETRFEDESGRDTGYNIAVQDIAKNALDRIKELEEKVEQNNWVSIDSAEDLPHLDQEYLLWDGCQHHLDYGEMCMDTGTFYFANGTKATHYKITDVPKDE